MSACLARQLTNAVATVVVPLHVGLVQSVRAETYSVPRRYNVVDLTRAVRRILADEVMDLALVAVAEVTIASPRVDAIRHDQLPRSGQRLEASPSPTTGEDRATTKECCPHQHS
jgi:Asp/Glu/hydantoin racemase